MKSISLFLLNLLFFNGYLTANVNREPSEISSNKTQQSNNSQFQHGKHSHVEFLAPIFETIGIDQLLQYSKDPRFSKYVIDVVFPKKYRNCVFHLQIDNMDLAEFSSGDVYIHDYDFYLDVIRTFGKWITKVGVVSPDEISDDQSIELYQTLFDHLANNLMEFQFQGIINEKTLSFFNGSFPKCVTSNLQLTTDQPGNISSYSNIFPNLKKFRLTIYNDEIDDDDENVVDENANVTKMIETEPWRLKHLEYLDIRGDLGTLSKMQIVKKFITKLLDKNSQIKIFECGRLNDFIDVVQKKLPNLEHLDIYDLDPEFQPTHLNSVRKLTVESGRQFPIDRLSFSNLESVSMQFLHENAAQNMSILWKKFFNNNQNIKEINCTMGYLQQNFTEGHNRFAEMLSELPNLNEIRIESSNIFDIDFLSQLLENHKHLLMLEYKVPAVRHPGGLDLRNCREKFENEWNINSYRIHDQGWIFITFQKKILM